MDDTSDSTDRTPARKSPALFVGLGIAACVIAPLWFIFIGPQMRHDRLVEKGIKVPGRLLAVDESGTTINDVTELELLVEFTRKDGKLDTAETDFLPTMRTMHMFQEGAGVVAAYDPEDPSEITITEISDGRAPAGGNAMGVMNNGPNVDSLAHLADSLKQEMEKMKKEMGR